MLFFTCDGYESFSSLLDPWESFRLPFEQISKFTMQRRTQSIQNVAAVALTLRMKHSMQSRVRNTRRFLEPIPTPSPPLENLLECADDHAGIIG